MASSTHLSVIDKINQDVAECVTLLKNQFEENDKYPISDESLTLQRFCAKLEFLLLHDIKEKSSVLGGKKSYWDYFCQCLSNSRKQPHDGVRFVKLKSELKSTRGRGRAFLRFCLSQGCLADTLQFCFDQTKITSDWYNEKGIPCNKEKWSSLVSSLYELNDIHFDLTPDCYGLDVSWPTFSRSKSFDSRLSWHPPSRSISVSSLNSQSEGPVTYPTDDERKESSEMEQKIYELCQAEADLYESRQRNVEMLKKEAKLLKEIEELKRAVETAKEEGELKLEKVVEEYANKAEILSIQSASREDYFKEAETSANDKIATLEDEKSRFQNQILDLEKRIDELETERRRAQERFDQKLTVFRNENEKLEGELLKAKSQCAETSSGLVSMTERAGSLSAQLLKTREDLETVGRAKAELLLKLNAFEDAKRLMEELSSDKEKLTTEMKRLKNELKNQSEKLEKNDIVMEKLGEEKEMLESRVNQLYQTITEKNLEMDGLRNELTEERQRLLGQVADLERVNNGLKKEMKRKNPLDSRNERQSELEEVNSKLSTFEQYGFLLTPLINQHEISVNRLYQNIDILYDISQKLKTEMKTLTLSMRRLANCSNSHLEFPSLNHEDDNDQDSGTAARLLPNEFKRTNSVPAVVATNDNFPLVNCMNILGATLDSISRKKDDIEAVVKTCQAFCTDMNNFAEERERKLMAKTIKLRHTKNVVACLAKEHKKMQSAEAILKFELQEKRKLLTKLRHQLETTREEYSRVRLKNLESEVEWQSLRDDFASRRKQPSEESGFVEETVSESSTSNSITVLESVPENSCPDLVVTPEDAPPSPTGPQVEGVEGVGDVPEAPAPPRSRLDILEEQCNMLYFTLLSSSKRSEILEQRLEAILGVRSREENSVSSEDSACACAASSEAAPVSESSDFLVEDASESDHDIPPVDEDDVTIEDPTTSAIPVWNQDENLEDGLATTNFSRSSRYVDDVAASIETGELENDSTTDLGEDCSLLRKRARDSIVAKLKSERKAFQAREAELQNEVTRLENEMTILREKNASDSTKDKDFKKRAEFIFRQERDGFVNKLQKASQEYTELQKVVEDARNQVQLKNEQLLEASAEIVQLKRQFSENETSLNQRVSSLQFQLSTEALKFERALKHYTGQEATILEMREKMNEQERLIYSLEEALGEIKEERRDETERRGQELEDLRLSLATRDEECLVLNEELKAMTIELNELKKYSEQVEEQAHKVEHGYRMKLEELNDEIYQLRSDNEELKKQIIKLTRDKDSLWKKSEHLSNSLAPGDRWLSDKEVTECMRCKATFSFTLRKHHCRLCGGIFCHGCSAYWILTAASSRRSRACQLCFSQYEGKRSGHLLLDPTAETGRRRPSTTSSSINGAHDSTDSESIDSSSQLGAGASASATFEPGSCREASENMEIQNSVSPSSDLNVDTNKANEMASEFDIISDEEITRSLSACSPYSPVPSPSDKPSSDVKSSSVTKTIEEILTAGLEGFKSDVWVNAGSSYRVPLLIEESGVAITWEFTATPKSIAFSVIYKEANEDKTAAVEDVLLKTKKVNSVHTPVQGRLVAKNPGLYVLLFDNRYSKFLAKKITYTLKIEHKPQNNN